MLEPRKPVGTSLVCQEVNQIFRFHLHWKRYIIFERRQLNLSFGPDVSGRPVKLYQIARYDE